MYAAIHVARGTRQGKPLAAPIDAIAAGLDTAGIVLHQRRGWEYGRRRQTVIAADTELQERELIKMASLASAVADALLRRGVREPAASLTAEAGVAVFRVAFDRWVNGTRPRDLSRLIRASLDKLKTVMAGEQIARTPKHRQSRVTSSWPARSD